MDAVLANTIAISSQRAGSASRVRARYTRHRHIAPAITLNQIGRRSAWGAATSANAAVSQTVLRRLMAGVDEIAIV